MWWSEHSAAIGRFTRLGLAFIAAGIVAGCFEPLYGDHSLVGGSDMRSKLSAVDVLPIDAPSGRPEARIGVEVRNALMFDMTGGGSSSSPTHRLKINLVATRQSVIVDIYTTRPDVENYGIDASYTLTELATGKVVVNGQTFARVSFDIPGQQQRFARARGMRDAENRAAKVIADQIRSRLASFFVAGT
jgi:LPS-assembly lipoprotein